MKIFHCAFCGNLLFFESVQCVKCGHPLGYLPEVGDLSAFEQSSDGTWQALTPAAKGQAFIPCANGREHPVCNWMVAAKNSSPLCIACGLNQMIPDLQVPGNLERWRKLELAKRRIIYTILRLGLPLTAVPQENRPALRFNLLGDPAGGPPVRTGHANGLITVNIIEADDPVREQRRVSLHEPYRTLLGHLRHEVAHYYWDRLIANSSWLSAFRELFGDATRDYAAALETHYKQGPPADWQTRHVSAYASAHSWEDWAETGAHYLHMVDTVETAAGFGITLEPEHPDARAMSADPQKAIDASTDFDTLFENWLPLTYALNSLNRGMGLPDLYPFVLSNPAIQKLRFIHRVVQSTRSRQPEAAREKQAGPDPLGI